MEKFKFDFNYIFGIIYSNKTYFITDLEIDVKTAMLVRNYGDTLGRTRAGELHLSRRYFDKTFPTNQISVIRLGNPNAFNPTNSINYNAEKRVFEVGGQVTKWILDNLFTGPEFLMIINNFLANKNHPYF